MMAGLTLQIIFTPVNSTPCCPIGRDALRALQTLILEILKKLVVYFWVCRPLSSLVLQSLTKHDNPIPPD